MDKVCLATLDINHVYCGVGWRKKHKAPTDYGFCIKHPKLQSKSSKFIKYLCADDERTLHRWMVGIRIAKSGRKLVDNYRALVEELAQVLQRLLLLCLPQFRRSLPGFFEDPAGGECPAGCSTFPWRVATGSMY